jgi:hypothetical protein
MSFWTGHPQFLCILTKSVKKFLKKTLYDSTYPFPCRRTRALALSGKMFSTASHRLVSFQFKLVLSNKTLWQSWTSCVNSLPWYSPCPKTPTRPLQDAKRPPSPMSRSYLPFFLRSLGFRPRAAPRRLRFSIDSRMTLFFFPVWPWIGLGQVIFSLGQMRCIREEDAGSSHLTKRYFLRCRLQYRSSPASYAVDKGIQISFPFLLLWNLFS